MPQAPRTEYVGLSDRVMSEALATLASGKNPDGTDFTLSMNQGAPATDANAWPTRQIGSNTQIADTNAAWADLAAAANAAAKHASFDPNGERTFTVGLSPTGLPPATAYWMSCQLTPAMATAIRARLRAAGATAAEVTPVPPGATPTLARVAVFDAEVWSAEEVLVAVGLRRVEVGV